MEFQSGQCHFGSSPRHLLGRIQRELPADTAISHSCMQEGGTESEEEPLYYQLPLSRILSWNRWWHITARVILIAYQKRFWGLLGLYLQEVRGIPLVSHPTAGRRRRQKGPPAAVHAPLPRLELPSDTENEHSMTLPEKKKRRGRDQNLLLQCRPPADIHMIMTRSWDDLDSTEYHDATEEPIRKEETEGSKSQPRPGDIQGSLVAHLEGVH